MPAPRLVLIHSPLLGPFSWRPVADELRRRGVPAETPAFPRLSAVEGDFYPALVASLAASVDGAGRAPAVLVAHSGAGPLIPALRARLQTPVEGVIFADAILPHPGRSWFDTAPPELRAQLRAGAEGGLLPRWDGWWPPGSLARLVPDEDLRRQLTGELELLPVDYFEEPAPAGEPTGACAFLQLSGAYEDEARRAARYGWPVIRLPLNHLATLTQPQAVAGALETLAAKLLEPTGG
jgi:hypothetical protein